MRTQRIAGLLALTVAFGALGFLAVGETTRVASAAGQIEDGVVRGPNAPRYTEDGRLMRPEGYETWVFVGASIGLSYAEGAGREGPGMFHHTYIQPEAYEHYRRTGEFPEKTMLVLRMYSSEEGIAPQRGGWVQGRALGIEAAVKDHERVEEGWAYYGFGGGRTAARPNPKERCYSCHLEHGGDDNVFTQFYPVLREAKEASAGR